MTQSSTIALAALFTVALAVPGPAVAQGVSPNPCPEDIGECPKPVGSIVPDDLAAAPSVSDVLACLVLPTEFGDFNTRLRAGADRRAADLGLQLRSFSGRTLGDTDSQTTAIEACISEGARGILLSAAGDTAALREAVQSARTAGLLVVALETPLVPADLADTTISTDGVRSGFHLGAWTAATLGDSARQAEIGMIDFGQSNPPWMTTRSQGFLHALGVDLADPSKSNDEADRRIVGHDGAFSLLNGGHDAVNSVMARASDLAVIYLPSDVLSADAAEVLAGTSTPPLTVAAFGSCEGLLRVSGRIDAMVLPVPERIGSLGVDAVAWFAAEGRIFSPSTFFDAGAWLVTDSPVEGLDSITVEEARAKCGR